MNAALLIGRKGSVGFPGKNLYPVLGRPLSYYPLAAALHCSCVDKVYMSTDDEELMALAKEHGAEIIERPQALCTKEALGEDVFVHGYHEIKERNAPQDIETMALMFCNAPMILPAQIEKGVRILQERPEVDSTVTVSRYNMWSPLRARRVGEDGFLHPFVPFEAMGDARRLNCDRDSQGDVWFADIGVSVVRPRCLEHIEEGLLPQKWMGKNICPLQQWGGLDVDYEWQIPQVEFWLRKNGFDEKKTPYDKD